VTIEDRLARIEDLLAVILREDREDRSKRQHQGGCWGSRRAAAEHHDISIDTVDARIADGTLKSKKLGPEPEDRRDKKGRRIDRRRVLVWIEGPPKTEAEIGQLASEARQ
jgi:hypothetical protein